MGGSVVVVGPFALPFLRGVAAALGEGPDPAAATVPEPVNVSRTRVAHVSFCQSDQSQD